MAAARPLKASAMPIASPLRSAIHALPSRTARGFPGVFPATSLATEMPILPIPNTVPDKNRKSEGAQTSRKTFSAFPFFFLPYRQHVTLSVKTASYPTTHDTRSPPRIPNSRAPNAGVLTRANQVPASFALSSQGEPLSKSAEPSPSRQARFQE